MHLLYNATLLHTIMNVFKMVIGNKNVHSRVYNKVIFTCKTPFHTKLRTLYAFVIGFYSSYSFRDRIDKFQILPLVALLSVALDHVYTLLYRHHTWIVALSGCMFFFRIKWLSYALCPHFSIPHFPYHTSFLHYAYFQLSFLKFCIYKI